jgi:cyclohexyl-isocyanide hydratase
MDRMSTPDQSRNDPFTIGMIVFDNMTNLDFVGPADIFARIPNKRLLVLAKTLDPITTDSGCRVLADTLLRDAPKLDLMFIGGGPGTTALMEDEEMLSFLRAREPDAQWVTSVCTGALVLGAAGLLRGYKAATHWTAMEVLGLLGAEPVNQRVVIDRNRITGGGVTAGIDFGLTILEKLYGADFAQTVQLGQEYAPQPPFNAGTPETAPPAVVERFRKLSGPLTQRRRDAAQRAASKFT